MDNEKNIYESKKDKELVALAKEPDAALPDQANDNKLAPLEPVNKELLNDEIKQLADDYAHALIKAKENYTPIHVDEIASSVARSYEKIRKVIDWKDDNALRRGAIERILKRILFPKLAGFSMKSFDAEGLAENITKEIIRSGHLPNHAVPMERIGVVAHALHKYLYFLEYISNYKSFEIKQKTNAATFVLEIAACEIEEILVNPVKEEGIMKAMTELLNQRLSVFPADSLKPEEKLEYVKISTQRTLYDLDDKYVIYQILKEMYPQWQSLDDRSIAEFSKYLPNIEKKFFEKINTPFNRKFDYVAEKIDTVFMLLDDILEQLKEKPKEIRSTLENKEEVTRLLTEAYEKRYKTLKTRLLRLAVFSTLSVFLSNFVTFYLVEVPLAHIFYEGFNFLAAAVDFLVPTAVMFFLVFIIRPPKEDNLKKVISVALKFLYKDEGREHYRIKIYDKKLSVFNVFMTLIYVITALGVFGGMAYIFYISKLPITSVIFDTFTIALNVFAAVVIRNQSRELNVEDERGFLDFILDVVTVPIAKVGSFMARKWKEYNIVSIFFNFVIETPLAAILGFIQGWSEYIRERRSELH